MLSVRIIRDYDWPNILRQTPFGDGKWDGIQFHEDAGTYSDYIIIIGKIRASEHVYCDPKRIWALTHEPPNEVFYRHHYCPKCAHLIFMQADNLKGSRYTLSQPALPWHVNYDYNWLKNAGIPDKPNTLSWITSSKTNFLGHRTRMAFLNSIRPKLKFHLYGYGFQALQNKWDGLASYRYSLAIENFSNSYYWSEKIADCFLSWTMPIYYGCTRIADYFPKESFVQIDITDTKGALAIIQETMYSDRWLQNREAIAEARRRILEEYQLFPFLSKKIRKWESTHPQNPPRLNLLSPDYRWYDALRFAATDCVQKPWRAFRNKVSKLLHSRDE